jgi:hypothetical protein
MDGLGKTPEMAFFRAHAFWRRQGLQSKAIRLGIVAGDNEEMAELTISPGAESRESCSKAILPAARKIRAPKDMRP